MENTNVAPNYIKASDISSFMAAHGYHLHHVATTRCYVSRATDYRRIEYYKGRFGVGYIIYVPNWSSTNYSYIAYYVKQEGSQTLFERRVNHVHYEHG